MPVKVELSLLHDAQGKPMDGVKIAQNLHRARIIDKKARQGCTWNDFLGDFVPGGGYLRHPAGPSP
jgi:hypothetical protein